MKRDEHTFTGDRDEVIDDLREYAEGQQYIGSQAVRDQALAAADAIANGADSAKVGHLRYNVR